MNICCEQLWWREAKKWGFLLSQRISMSKFPHLGMYWKMYTQGFALTALRIHNICSSFYFYLLGFTYRYQSPLIYLPIYEFLLRSKMDIKECSTSNMKAKLHQIHLSFLSTPIILLFLLLYEERITSAQELWIIVPHFHGLHLFPIITYLQS
jgi:hypothetical protein